MIVRAFVRLVLVTLAVLAALVPFPASLVERWYSSGIYPALQSTITPVTNRVPVALFDVAAIGLAAALVWRFARVRRRSGFLRAGFAAAAGLVTAGAVLYLLFLAIWGLNYRRVPIERKVEFDASRVTREAARHLARDAVSRLNALHAEAHRDEQKGPPLERAFIDAQHRLGLPGGAVAGVPKDSALQFYFRWAAIDGMTVPFFLEIILNPDILPIEQSFVLAHEWGHLAGYADEDEANLIAWLTCLRGNARAQYSGWLAIYGHVLSALPREDRAAIAAQLDRGPRQDLRAIAERYALSKPAVRQVARGTYDAYLRANRVEEGIESYDAVVRLILGAGAAHGWAPRALASGGR